MAANLAGMAFIPYYKHLMELLETNKDLKRTGTGILKQMGWAAGGALAGGVVGGPPGALVGSIVGSIVGYSRSDNYDSLVSVIKKLTDEEKAILVKKVQELVGSSGIEALTTFITSQVQRELLIGLLREFTQTKGGG